jgi:hypothetical protein
MASKDNRMAAQAPAQQQVFLTAEQFLRMTKPKSVKITSDSPYADGGRQTFRLPQSGLAQAIWVSIQAAVTVSGTVTSGTLAGWPNPAPFGMIKRMRFGSNNAFNMRDLSGWSLYKWVRMRTGIDPYPQVPVADPRHSFSVVNDSLLGNSMVNAPVPGANIAAGTYLCNFCFPIPISYNNAGEQGLLVLQQNSTFYDLSIDWGQIVGGISATGGSNDFFTDLVGTGLSISADIKLTAGLDWFEPVAGIGKLISMFMSVSDMTISPLTSGENVVRPPVNDYYTMFNLELVNNGAPVSPTDIQNLIFQHSGNVYDYQDDMLIRLAKNYYLHGGLPPVDGAIEWDLGMRRGNILRRDTLDAFDDMNITDLQLRFTLPSSLSITGVNQGSLIMESLRYIRQI